MTQTPKSSRSPRSWSQSSFGERIDFICRLRGWSLNKLGEEAGIASGPMSRLSRITEHVASSPDTIQRIADAADVNVEWLMLGRGPVERGSSERSASERTPRGALRAHPDWPHALAEARKRQKAIPEKYWEHAGDSVVVAENVDWQLVVGLVRELYSADQRKDEVAPTEASPTRRDTPSTMPSPRSPRRR
jgi:transcriptional regulator with XRE-family HTH domain